jgi:hypothetical protein
MSGPGVALEISAVDECNTRIRPDKIVKHFRENGGFGMVVHARKVAALTHGDGVAA